MAANTARQIALAQRLITKNGRSVTFQRLSATAADATKPWKGPGTPTVAQTQAVDAVFLPANGSVDLGKLGIDKELLKRVEQVCMVAGITGTDLSTFSTILDSSSRFKIDWYRELKPSDGVVLYVFGVSR